ncbi:histidine phosphatase family protein [Marisediminicola antarctica]
MTIALTRHGETDWNAAGRMQGTSDIPLNDTGREQARASSERFVGGGWHHVVTSPLSRASETGRIIADGLGIAMSGVYSDLQERHYGEAEGLTDAEAAALWSDGEFPGLESRDDVADRGLDSLVDIARDLHGSAVIVVAHGTLIREVLRRLTSVPIPSILNGATSIVERSGGSWRVITVNDEPLDDEPLSDQGA